MPAQRQQHPPTAPTLVLAALLLVLPFSVCDRSGSTEKRLAETAVEVSEPGWIMINMRLLEQDELQAYLSTKTSITSTLRKGPDGDRTAAARLLLDEIESLPVFVQEDSRFSLRGHLVSELAKLSSPEGRLMGDLLADHDVRLQELALRVLCSGDFPERALSSLELREQLLSMLRSSTTDPSLKPSILWVFELADEFTIVEPDALALAREESEPILAREAATTLCHWGEPEEARVARLLTFFGESEGILRQELALCLPGDPNWEIPQPERREIVSVLLAMAANHELTPVDRGRAIRALGYFVDDDGVLPLLLSLLEQENWFFGVTGQHHPVHSLVPVIEILGDLERDDLRQRLHDLVPELLALDERTRVDIDIALGAWAHVDVTPREGEASDDANHPLVAAAIERTTHSVTYDGSYRSIAYPGGDVPGNLGVCTDVVIRSYRALGIDLQQAVHEDMKADFSAYPDIWGLTDPDPNIDHRRVPNLRTFLRRQGAELPVTRNPADYHPGDLVTWMLPRNLPHIGIVVDRRSADGERFLVVHNIGAGPKVEDRLFKFPITGHYRYPVQQ